jgi:hypothetical protein
MSVLPQFLPPSRSSLTSMIGTPYGWASTGNGDFGTASHSTLISHGSPMLGSMRATRIGCDRSVCLSQAGAAFPTCRSTRCCAINLSMVFRSELAVDSGISIPHSDRRCSTNQALVAFHKRCRCTRSVGGHSYKRAISSENCDRPDMCRVCGANNVVGARSAEIGGKLLWPPRQRGRHRRAHAAVTRRVFFGRCIASSAIETLLRNWPPLGHRRRPPRATSRG